MKKSNHNFSLLTLSIIFLVLLALYIWANIKVGTLQQATDNLQMDIQNKTTEITNAEQINLQKKTEDEMNDLSKLNSYFLVQGQEFILIQDIEKICNDAHVECTIQPVGIDNPKDLPTGFQSLHVIVTGKGTFKALYQLTSILEKLPYKISISQVGLEMNPDSSTKENQWKETFDFNVITTEA